MAVGSHSGWFNGSAKPSWLDHYNYRYCKQLSKSCQYHNETSFYRQYAQWDHDEDEHIATCWSTNAQVSSYLNKNETSKVSTFFKSYYWSHKHHYDCYAMKWCYVEICHHDSSQKLKGRNDSKRQFIIQPHPEKICRLEIYSDTYTHSLSLSHTLTQNWEAYQDGAWRPLMHLILSTFSATWPTSSLDHNKNWSTGVKRTTPAIAVVATSYAFTATCT